MTHPTLADALRQAVVPTPDGAAVTVGPATIDVLGHEVRINAGATLTTRLHPAGAPVEAFGLPLPSSPPDGQVHGELVLRATSSALR